MTRRSRFLARGMGGALAALALAAGPACAQTLEPGPPPHPLWQSMTGERAAPRADLGAPLPTDRDRPVRVNLAIDPAELPGLLSIPLSDACARGRFNQDDNRRYYVVVAAPPDPPLRLGFAGPRGFNLVDPDGLGEADQLYLFDLDDTSECRVYVSAQ